MTFGWFLVTAVGTFGKHGPGHALGNYFFGVWTSLILSLYVFKKTMLEHVAQQATDKAKEKTDEQPQRKSQRSSQKRNRIPGLIQDDQSQEDKTAEEDESPLSTSATDDMERVNPVSPSLMTPQAYPRPQKSSSTKSRQPPRDPIAISLEESFRNEDDVEQGLRILRDLGEPTRS